MGLLPAELVPAMAALEACPGPLRECEASSAIQCACKARWPKGSKLPPPWLAEYIAFDFCPNYRHEEYTDWNTYYGPQSILATEGGSCIIHPNIRQITPEIIAYWKQRFQEAKHPILRLRYADLVWDFSPKVCKKSGGIESARTVIDATIEVAERSLAKHVFDGSKKLNRALSISLRIKDIKRQEKLATTILAYERNHAENEAAGTWGLAFDSLLGDQVVAVTQEQESEIIQALEARLAWVGAIPEDGKYPRDHFAAEVAAERLARYYVRKQRNADKERVLQAYAQAVLSASKRTMALVACTWLRKAYDLMRHFGFSDEEDRLAVAMGERGATAKDELVPISFTTQVPKDEIDRCLDELMKNDEDTALAKVVDYFIPDPVHAESQVKKMAKKMVLSSIVSLTMIDESGRNVATVGSVEEDLAGRVVKQIADNMIWGSMFLTLALGKWIEHYRVTPEKLVMRLLTSPVFKPEQKPVLLRGVQAYFDKDDIAAIHFLVPQIEAAIRQLFVICRRNIWRLGRNGGLDLYTLGDLLRDKFLAEVLDPKLGSKIPKYLQVFLVDPRGWNIRNEVCHGMLQFDGNCRQVSDRLLHVLLFLSFIRKTEKNPDTDSKKEGKT